MFFPAFVTDHCITFDIDHPLALGAVGGKYRIGPVLREESNRTLTMMGHRSDHRVSSIENGRAFGPDVFNDDPFYHCELVHRSNEVEAKVVADTDIGNDRDIAAVKAQTLTEDAATGCFENGRIDIWMHQNITGAAWATAVTVVGALAFDVDAIGAGHADPLVICFKNSSDQTAGRGFAVGSGNRDDRDAGIVTIREHHVDDRLTDRAAFTK